MFETTTIAALILLLPLAAIITYFDVRYRRIPNLFVLATLVSGLIINFMAAGLAGLTASAGGCLLAFGLMFVLHIFGAMGAGDVKLFAAVGAVLGTQARAAETFLVVLLTGGVLAVYTILRNGTVLTTLTRVLQIFVGLVARLADAALRRAGRPPTHDALRRGHHARQPHLALRLPRLSGGGCGRS